MTSRDARKHDDGRDDPLNPIVVFRMSDRLDIYGLKVKVNIILALTMLVAALIGAGMLSRFM